MVFFVFRILRIFLIGWRFLVGLLGDVMKIVDVFFVFFVMVFLFIVKFFFRGILIIGILFSLVQKEYILKVGGVVMMQFFLKRWMRQLISLLFFFLMVMFLVGSLQNFFIVFFVGMEVMWGQWLKGMFFSFLNIFFFSFLGRLQGFLFLFSYILQFFFMMWQGLKVFILFFIIFVVF